MTRYEYYKILEKLNNDEDSLQHMQSPLLGEHRQGSKYYRREGKPGSYRYFYTKAEYDAAHKDKKLLTKANTTGNNFDGDAYQKWLNEQKIKKQQEENFRKNKEYAENAEREKQERIWRETNLSPLAKALRYNLQDDRTPLEKAQQGREAAESKARKEEYKRILEEKRQQEIQQKLEEEKKKNEAYSINVDKDKADKMAKEKEKAEKEAAERVAEELKLKEKIENSDYMLHDSNSPLAYSNAIQYYALNGYQGPALDKSIDDTYNVIQAYKETEEIDPDTGLKLKNYELPIEDEIKMVNPGFWYSEERPNEMLEHQANCYACTTAMALREKGYDVTAGEDKDGISSAYYNATLEDAGVKDSELDVAYNDLWSGNFTKWQDASNTITNLSKEPAGSYGDLCFEYYDALGNYCGHSIFYKVDDSGTVHYYDCQVGIEVASLYLYGTINIARYKRLDDKEFKGAEKMLSTNKISGADIKEVIKK